MCCSLDMSCDLFMFLGVLMMMVWMSWVWFIKLELVVGFLLVKIGVLLSVVEVDFLGFIVLVLFLSRLGLLMEGVLLLRMLEVLLSSSLR